MLQQFGHTSDNRPSTSNGSIYLVILTRNKNFCPVIFVARAPIYKSFSLPGRQHLNFADEPCTIAGVEVLNLVLVLDLGVGADERLDRRQLVPQQLGQTSKNRAFTSSKSIIRTLQ